MLKTWHEARRICGEWSCFHVFSCVHFHFRCIQIGFISRIYLTILDASTLAALRFNKRRCRFLPPLSRADLGGFPMSCASRKTPSSTATTTWLHFPARKKTVSLLLSKMFPVFTSLQELFVQHLTSRACLFECNSSPSKLGVNHPDSKLASHHKRPPSSESPHATTDPSKVIAANALPVAWICCTLWRDPWTASLSPPGILRNK